MSNYSLRNRTLYKKKKKKLRETAINLGVRASMRPMQAQVALRAAFIAIFDETV